MATRSRGEVCNLAAVEWKVHWFLIARERAKRTPSAKAPMALVLLPVSAPKEWHIVESPLLAPTDEDPQK